MPTKVKTSDAALRSRYSHGESMLAISESLGISRSTVRRRLMALGVELRTDSGPSQYRAEARASSSNRLAALTHLRDTHADVKAAVAARVNGVARAKRAGATWEEIGEAVEQAPSNAYNKYKKLIAVETTTKVTVRKKPS